jgi:hypothetical protein
MATAIKNAPKKKTTPKAKAKVEVVEANKAETEKVTTEQALAMSVEAISHKDMVKMLKLAASGQRSTVSVKSIKKNYRTKTALGSDFGVFETIKNEVDGDGRTELQRSYTVKKKGSGMAEGIIDAVIRRMSWEGKLKGYKGTVRLSWQRKSPARKTEDGIVIPGEKLETSLPFLNISNGDREPCDHAKINEVLKKSFGENAMFTADPFARTDEQQKLVAEAVAKAESK